MGKTVDGEGMTRIVRLSVRTLYSPLVPCGCGEWQLVWDLQRRDVCGFQAVTISYFAISQTLSFF